jgi:hypothetical protein
MLSAQGLAQHPSSILVLIVVLALVVILWWRIALIAIGVAVLTLLGLGAIALLHALG